MRSNKTTLRKYPPSTPPISARPGGELAYSGVPTRPWEAGINPNYTGAGMFEWCGTRELVVRPAGGLNREQTHWERDTGWVADCGSASDAEQIANAMLIAAAPELYAACKALADLAAHLPVNLTENGSSLVGLAIEARKACAKAERRIPVTI